MDQEGRKNSLLPSTSRAYALAPVATPLVRSSGAGAKPLWRNKVTHGVITFKF